MDDRVDLLIEELVTHPQGENIDLQRWRKRFDALFAEPIDGDSREALLNAYNALLDLAERGIVKSGGNLEGFQNAREADWRVLCIQEAQLFSGDGEDFSPAVLGAIVERELAAGRIQESDWTKLAAAGAEVLGEKPAKKKGWLGRLFGT